MIYTVKNLFLKLFPSSKCLSDSQINSMKNVIEYVYDKEAKDYHYQKEDGADVVGHIFEDIVKVDKFLSKKVMNND